MPPLLILFIGMVVVLAGIVVFRWHAFLSLIAAALTIALLTSPTTLVRHEMRQSSVVVNAEDLSADAMTPAAVDRHQLFDGVYQIIRSPADERDAQGSSLGPIGTLSISHTADGSFHAAAMDQVSITSTATLKPADRLVSSRDWATISERSQRSVGERVAAGFGDTCRKIGILIAMAAIIGHCLLRSGGAQRIIDTACSLMGDSRTSIGFVISGFVLAIPVFFDTVFYLLIPLAKALYRRTGKNYLLYVMSIVVGATMAHSLVPPTPGPLLVASELNLDLGIALKAGLLVGAICALVGYAYAVMINRRWSVEPTLEQEAFSTDSESNSPTDTESSQPLPSLWFSLLPVVLPLVLLASGANWQALGGGTSEETSTQVAPWVETAIEFASDKNIALTLSAAAALLLLASSPRRDNVPLAKHVQAALSEAGSIILITAAGGALGAVIRETGIAEVLVDAMPAHGSGVMVLCVAFFVTVLIRFVQGSATVAMITSVAIVGPMATAMALPFHPVYLFLAIGCGSKPLPWMNDSGFWVIGRLSGMTPKETLRSFSATLTVMGFAGFLVTLIGATLWPMVGPVN
ncbi:GntP family permease [Allorhodopirellula solitaria]|uniref:Inner membrane permease YgbN n=1 Tax=Allorhodopirellula solitaria TaxID=2527987 RepID=A0A5C5X2L6_9BACT|nr:GntP family permease [Allorhodopirellula solitaria]TWT56403.1 Inner membrane permease YgbN [Allorhodopirellula solitaria]